MLMIEEIILYFLKALIFWLLVRIAHKNMTFLLKTDLRAVEN